MLAASVLGVARVGRSSGVIVEEGRFDRRVTALSDSPRARRQERIEAERAPPPPGTSMRTFAVESAATVGIVGALSAVEWHQVDSNVYQAFEHLSHMQANGFMDLQQMIDIKQYPMASEAFQSTVQGHVAEWKVGHDFLLSDHGVAMAAGPTQPGWDLLIDGNHQVNVKDWTNVAAAASRHFASHPDIPIVVPGDAHNIPHDAVYFHPGEQLDPSVWEHSHQVIVDTALSHADTADQVSHASSLSESHGIADHGIPIATLLIAGYRETKLVRAGDTDAVRATLNDVQRCGQR